MKKVKVLLLIILIIVPIFVKAIVNKSYNDSKSDVNTYINKYSDKNKYLIFNMPYVYNGTSSTNNNDFYNGGLISKNEYDLSKGNTSSYLTIGREFWTLSSYGSNQYYVDHTILHKNPDNVSGVRVTEFVKPNVNVTGKGTYANPWVFLNQYSLTIRVESNRYGSVSLNTNNSFENSISKMVDAGTSFEFKIKENSGYVYKSSDCNMTKTANISNNVSRYKTQPINQDTVCTINFEKRKITVSYNCNGGNGTPPSSSTILYGDSYSIEDYTCTKDGYKQKGWKTSSGSEWYKGDTGVSTLENGERGLSDNKLVLEPIWDANKYTITFYQGNGTTTAGSSSIGSMQCVYNSQCTLPDYSTFSTSAPLSAKENSEDCDYLWSFYGWTDSNSSLTLKYNNKASFTYSKVGNMSLYVLERRKVYFNTGIAPSSVSAEVYQYWNPYQRSANYVSEVEIKPYTNITGWTFIGYKGGSSSATSDVDYASSLVGTNQKLLPTTCKVFRSKYQRNISLIYNKNGGSGTMANSTAVQYYNSGYASSGANKGAKVSVPSFTLKANEFTRDGYAFSKWAAGSVSGTTYSAESTYSGFSPDVEDSTSQNMYAIWKDSTKPKVIVTAKDYNNTSNVLKSAQTFTADGTYTVDTSWINKYVTFQFESSDAGVGISNIVWYQNNSGSASDTGTTYQSNPETINSGFSNITKSFTSQGYRKGKWVVTDKDGNSITITVVAKIDKTSPSCSLSANSSKVTLSTSDNYRMGSYGMGTSSSASYNSTSSMNINKTTFYGYVIDEAGNTGSCSIVITGTTAASTQTTYTCTRSTSSYDKTVYTCGRTFNNYTKTTKTCDDTGDTQDILCDTSAKYNSPQSYCPSEYTFMDQNCNDSYECSSGTMNTTDHYCYKSATLHNCSSFTSQSSCISNKDHCTWSGAKCTGKWYTCDTGWTSSGTQCKKAASHVYTGNIRCHKYNFSWVSSTTYPSTCSTTSSFTCDKNHWNSSYVSSCTANYTYSMSSSSSNGVSSCSASTSFTCSSSTYGSSYTTCNTNYSYGFTSSSINTSSCTATSSFTCNSSKVNSSYVTCDTKYNCPSGYTKINDTYCYR